MRQQQQQDQEKGNHQILAQAQASAFKDVETADASEQVDASLSQVDAQTVSQVWTSKFAIGQLVFNVLASFAGPLGTFYFLFGFLSQGPYEWHSGPLLGVVLGSLVGSPLLIFALMPVGLPEAVQHGWFPKITEKTLLEQERNQQHWLLSSVLIPIWKWPWATKRNVAIGFLSGIVIVPVAVIIARFALGPTLSTWTLIWFNVVFEVVLAVPVLLLGLVGYSVETNLDQVLERMSDHPNCMIRLLRRTCVSLRMTFVPN